VRIVICDDHRLLLEALSSSLACHGYIVEAATSTPADAIRAVRLHDPDVLMMDLGFPGGETDGLSAAEEVALHHPHTKVVVLTASDDHAPVRRALELGVVAYVRKDQKIGGIIGVLERVGRGESAFDETLVKGLARAGQVPRPRAPVDDLTPREWDIAHLLERGLSTVEIMERLGVSKSTVRSHVHTILSKLRVHSRVQAVALLAEMNGSATSARGGHGELH
jgi:DNA-binding NarL/FixJ family response regulator